MSSNRGMLTSRPRAADNYAEAKRRVTVLESIHRATLIPQAVVRLRSHGRAVDRVAVLIHGYTSCPVQFDALGDALFELGYNVLISPLPRHGLADRSSLAHAALTSDELVAYCNEVLDIASGLGRQRIVAGLSAGGLLAAWTAQFRGDVDTAIPMAPTFGYKLIPTALTRLAVSVLQMLPNFFPWWDELPRTDARFAYMYPRFASHTLAQLMRLGLSVSASAQVRPPAAGRIILVLNGNEPSVNNRLARRIAQRWRRKGADVLIHEFPAELGLPHDMIDPLHPRARTADVYPVLIDLITQQRRVA